MLRLHIENTLDEENKMKICKLSDIARFTTGKLNSNAATMKGRYPFFTCAPKPLTIDTYAYDTKAVILAGNNAEGNFHIQYYEGKFNAYQRTYIIETNDETTVDIRYLYYALKICLLHFKQISQGTATKFLTAKILNAFELPIPRIEEQQKIAFLLAEIDEKIKTNEIINNNLLQQLHILYSRLFCDSAMDTPLGEVVATTSGGTPSRKHDEYYSDSSICWVKSKELLGNYIHETEEHINDLAIKKSSAKLLPKHSVLIAMYGATVGACGVISKPMTCNQAVCALLCNENYPYTYLFQIAYESQQKFINLAVGSAQQNISQVLIKQLNLHSDLNIIQKFHGLALPMHQEIESLQAENMHLAALRDNLLPKLMSGELDVSNIDL